MTTPGAAHVSTSSPLPGVDDGQEVEAVRLRHGLVALYVLRSKPEPFDPIGPPLVIEEDQPPW